MKIEICERGSIEAQLALETLSWHERLVDFAKYAGSCALRGAASINIACPMIYPEQDFKPNVRLADEVDEYLRNEANNF